MPCGRAGWVLANPRQFGHGCRVADVRCRRWGAPHRCASPVSSGCGSTGTACAGFVGGARGAHGRYRNAGAAPHSHGGLGGQRAAQCIHPRGNAIRPTARGSIGHGHSKASGCTAAGSTDSRGTPGRCSRCDAIGGAHQYPWGSGAWRCVFRATSACSDYGCCGHRGYDITAHGGGDGCGWCRWRQCNTGSVAGGRMACRRGQLSAESATGLPPAEPLAR